MAKAKKSSLNFDKLTKKAKKLLTPPVLFVLAFALIASAALIYTYAAPGGKKGKPGGDSSTTQLINLSLSPSAPRASNGSNITFEVRLNTQNQPINAAQAILTYDTSKLEFVSIDSEQGVLDMKLIEKGGDGKVELVHGTAQKYAGNGLLARVTFKALADKGKTQIGFDATSALAHADTNTNILQQQTGATVTLSR